MGARAELEDRRVDDSFTP
jgi:catechol 2,3-dioxygenase-like lactoylglutathione lyase family enzyme